MRQLSHYGTIEELTIIDGRLNVVPEIPLTFNKLKSLECRSCSYPGFLRLITQAEMPLLQKCIYNELDKGYRTSAKEFEEQELYPIDDLVTSKISLKLLSYALHRKHAMKNIINNFRKLTVYYSDDNCILVTLKNNAELIDMQVLEFVDYTYITYLQYLFFYLQKILLALSIYPHEMGSFSRAVNLERPNINKCSQIYINKNILQSQNFD